MAQDKKENKTPGKTILASGFRRTLLIIFAALLTFAGPTYVVYAFNSVLKINYAISIVSGFVLFIVGLAIIWYLIKQKVVT
ncbi:hypothetical protein A3K79_07030 [Candidatus Bathyarchaeota archaeon RBG_13_46_16b]|nr:MAG: hypothetical protein A3K79_07030 [Candidatus Bathyarchaeota archaeon RBG_13_46_16b]